MKKCSCCGIEKPLTEFQVRSASADGLTASSLGRIMVDTYEAPTPNGGTRVYGGQPSWIDPSDQSPPPDYCHEIDHGTAEDRTGS